MPRFFKSLVFLSFVYIVLFLQLGIICFAQSEIGAFKEDWSFKSISDLQTIGKYTELETKSTSTVSINPSEIINRIYLNGGNVEHGQSELGEPQFIYNVNALKTKYLRFPGGSKSDIYIWNKTKETRQELVQYLNLVKATQTEPVITLNFGSFRNNIDEGTQVARDLVEYLNNPDDGTNPNGGINWALTRTRDGFKEPFNVKYFEVGNENYGEWEYGTCDNYPKATVGKCINQLKSADYIKAFEAYQKEVNSISPKSYWGVSLSNNSHTSFDSEVVKNLKSHTDFYDLHIYPFKSADFDKPVTDQTKIAKQNTSKAIDYAQKTISDSGDNSKPLIIGEFNATTPEYNNLVSKTGSFGTSLSLLEMLGTFTERNIGTSFFWAYTAGFDESIGTSGSPGYHLFTSSNTPKTTPLTPYPAYYPQLLWNQMGDTLIQSDTTDKSLQIWASKYSGLKSGQAILVVNPTNDTKKPTINFYDKMGTANITTLSGEYSSNTSFLNKISTNGQFGGPFPDQIKPILAHIDNDRAIFSLPPHSITLIQTNTLKAKAPVTPQINSPKNSDISKNWWDVGLDTTERFVDNNYFIVGFGVLTGISALVLFMILAWQSRTVKQTESSQIDIDPQNSPRSIKKRQLELNASKARMIIKRIP